MKMTDRDLNLISEINEYQFMELKDKIDQIKNILKLNIYNYPHNKSSNTSYYITVSGSHRIIIIRDDFTNIANYNQKQKNDAYNKITELDFKFIFKNEDNLILTRDNFNSIENFLGSEKFINNFDDLNGPLGYKAVLVIYEKM